MKKQVLSFVLSLLFLVTLATSYAYSGDWRSGIRSRIHEDQQRIQRGIDRGSLTKQEAKELRRELARILDKMDRMKQDGHLDRRDRERINRDLDRLSVHISREKRDNERRR